MTRPAMVMGAEMEYGIYVRGDGGYDSKVVGEANEAIQRAIREGADAMGRQLEISVGGRYVAYQHLANGARSYTDCGHPELSTPECPTPRDVVIWDSASDRIVQLAATQASEKFGAGIVVYKKLIDGRGHTWGYHENYCIAPGLYHRITREQELVFEQRTLATWLAVRQLLIGQGKIGSDHRRRSSAFQLSQRADFIESFRSDSTMHNRPLIQTRDEPLAKSNTWRRLHIICGDANLCQWATYFKMSLTGLLLLMWQDPELTKLPPLPVIVDERYHDVARFISHDNGLTARYPIRMLTGRGRLGNLRHMTAAEILSLYIDAFVSFAEGRTWSSPGEADAYRVAARKAQWAAGLLRERNWRGLYGWLDWPTKLVIIEEYLHRKKRTWSDVIDDLRFRRRVKLLGDFNYAALNPAVSMFERVAKTGAIRTVVKRSEIARAMMQPPTGRAAQRAAIAERYSPYIRSAHWDTMILYQEPFDVTLSLEDPLGCASEELEFAIERCTTPLDLAAYIDLYPISGMAIGLQRRMGYA